MERAEDSSDALNEPILPQKRVFFTPQFKKFLFIGGYLCSIPLFIVFLLLCSLALKYEGGGYIIRQNQKPRFQALPSVNNTSSADLSSQDARVGALEDLFARYDSPLKDYSKLIVTEADKNGIDYRLLPAIAMQESTLCKRIIKDSHNCWGYGIYSGKVTKFPSYEKAITTITANLAKKYIQQGYDEPSEIVQKYTPGDTGHWPQVVSHVMQKITNSL